MRSSKFWIGVFGGIAAAILMGLFALPALGLFEMTASGKPGLLDWWGDTNWHTSLMWRAPDKQLPESADAAEGLEHYRSSCLICHGAPEVARAEWAHAMQPMPPQLWRKQTQQFDDGQLYYIIHGGVRMTGMPAFGNRHREEEIWDIVAVVRNLDGLSEKQKQRLKQAASRYQHEHGGEHHHGSGHNGAHRHEKHADHGAKNEDVKSHHAAPRRSSHGDVDVIRPSADGNSPKAGIKRIPNSKGSNRGQGSPPGE